MKNEILRLRQQGCTYKEIQEILGCSKSTISFHCGEGQKEKTLTRTRKFRSTIKGNILQRIWLFQKRNLSNTSCDKNINRTFTVNDFIKKFGIKTKCGLTGIQIDLENDKNWDLDHIIPKSKGGDNSLNNCQILLRDVNHMKHHLLKNELIDYCLSILINNGYTVIKNEST